MNGEAILGHPPHTVREAIITGQAYAARLTPDWRDPEQLDAAMAQGGEAAMYVIASAERIAYLRDMNRYGARERRSRAAGAVSEAVCLHCGTAIEASMNRGVAKKYCSTRCRVAPERGQRDGPRDRPQAGVGAVPDD